MPKFYNDYHGRARLDLTANKTEWKADNKLKAYRLLLDEVEHLHVAHLSATGGVREQMANPLHALFLVASARKKLEALTG